MSDQTHQPPSPQEDWDNYYKNCPNIPWAGSKMTFLANVWYWFNLSRTGVVLDIGCGQGDKATFLAQTGLEVWGVDIAPFAIKKAKEVASIYKFQPHFLAGDVAKIDELSEIGKQKFDIVLDLFSTQFLTDLQRSSYLSGLQRHLKPHQTFYILQCFAKDDREKQPNAPSTKKNLPSLSFKEVKQSYGQYFEVLYHERTRDKLERKLSTYILKSGDS